MDRVLSSLILLGLPRYLDFDPRLALAGKRISLMDILFFVLACGLRRGLAARRGCASRKLRPLYFLAPAQLM